MYIKQEMIFSGHFYSAVRTVVSLDRLVTRFHVFFMTLRAAGYIAALCANIILPAFRSCLLDIQQRIVRVTLVLQLVLRVVMVVVLLWRNLPGVTHLEVS